MAGYIKEIDGTVSISWEPDATAAAALQGRHGIVPEMVVNGYPVTVPVDGVRFAGDLVIRLTPERSDLQQLVDQYKARQAQIQAEREARWEAERIAERAEELSHVPAGMVAVWLSEDYMGPLYHVDGEDTIFRTLTISGYWTRPGALAACLGWATPEAITEARAILTAEADAETAKAEAEAAAKTAEANRVKGCFEAAAASGERVVISHYMDECDGSEMDCSYDSVTQYAMPDGSTKTVRTHTF